MGLKYTIYLINIVILFIILLLPPDGFSYFKSFAGIVLLYNIPGFLVLDAVGFLKKKLPLYSTFLFSLVTGFSLWFVPLFIISRFKLPVPSTFIYTITAICFVVFLYTLFKKAQRKQALKIGVLDVVMIVLFNILLFVYLTPLKGLLVAPLHDPAAISIYARKLIENNYILTNLSQNYSYYPPGGYYLIGLVADLMHLDPSKTTMILTNLFNVFTGFSFATLTSKLFKGKHIAWVSVLTFSFLFTFPAYLYFTQGKNAQIIALVFFFTALSIFFDSIGNKIPFKLLFCLIAISSILLHYNNLLVTLVFSISIYVYKLIKEKYNSKKISKDFLVWCFIILIGIGILYLQLQTLRNIDYFQNSILRPLDTNEKFSGAIGIEDLFDWLLPYDTPKVEMRNNTVMLILGLISYLTITISSTYHFVKRKKINRETIFFFFFLLFYYISLYIELGAITRYYKYNRIIFLLIPISFVIAKIFDSNLKLFKRIKINYLLITLFLIFGYCNMRTLYKSYTEARFLSVVKEEDVKAFEWINQNLPQDIHILPANWLSYRRYNMDSSLYMKAYTNNRELFAFVSEAKLENEKSLKNKFLSLKKNPTNEDLLKNFTASNVNYIFSGSHKPWGCGELPCNFFDNYPEIYKIIYDYKGVKIYKINIE